MNPWKRSRKPTITAMKFALRMETMHKAAFLFLCLGPLHPEEVFAQITTSTQAIMPSSVPSKLERHYEEGERVAYTMRGINEEHLKTARYDAHVEGLVKKDPTGGFIEEFAWRDLRVNGEPSPLSPASLQFRQLLSLAPGYPLSVPDLSKPQPILIGPITDLLTFYADVQLAMKQKDLIGAGDHIYVKNGVPNSWADGTYVVHGQDAVDFDITLRSIDQATQIATLIVRHRPPAHLQIKLPATWMLSPIGDTANNWVQVEKNSDDKFVAAVGQETFEANFEISMNSGRIVSATLDNPVEILERDCDDSALAVCGPPRRYRIRRQITLDAASEPNRDFSSGRR